ncbi:MAG: hypothetical protein AB7P50_21205 [Alphaproteobacteria bacterium]
MLKSMRTKAHAAKIAELEQTLGTASAAETARVALFFGATIGRDLEIPDKIGIVMDRSLMAGHEIMWNRPFVPDEDVVVTVTLLDVFDKGTNRFAVVESRFDTPSGEEIQRQHSTFVMRVDNPAAESNT